MPPAHDLAHRQARDVFSLSKKVEEVLHEAFERIAERVKKEPMDPRELDAQVDQTRDDLVMPFAQYVRRSSRKYNSDLLVSVKKKIFILETLLTALLYYSFFHIFYGIRYELFY